MAGDELHTIRLRNDFYKDGSYKIYLALLVALGALGAICLTCLFLFLTKPAPVVFAVDKEFRVFPPVPLSQSYVSDADLIQWVSDVIPQAFTYDFINYNEQSQAVRPFFSDNGFTKLTDILNNYINTNTLVSAKQYVNTTASSAPIILKQGVNDARYTWLVQMPLVLTFRSGEKVNDVNLVLNITVSRINTLNDLLGITIENIMVIKNPGSKS